MSQARTNPTSGQAIAEFCANRLGLVAPGALLRAHACQAPEVAELLCRPGEDTPHALGLDSALRMINDSDWPLDEHLVPLMRVDEESFACVVATREGEDPLPGQGAVVRWHIGLEGPKAPEHQAALLATAADDYVVSVAEELGAREEGLHRMLDEIGPAYEVNYGKNAKRPRDFVVRPVRLACQNVIVGLAAFAHDSAIDGMAVLAWQTCELPHVAAHEGNRALAALMLCDAFQSGGTMEVRFDRPGDVAAEGETPTGDPVKIDAHYPGHPEMHVPASLRRYGRTVGIELGRDNWGSISPAEARDLFLAVTPMPDELSTRVRDAAARGIASPERLCFTLLSQTWREVELDFLLALSHRAGSILRGGAPWTRRVDRQAESQVARAALISGMLYRRLDSTDTAGADGGARALEDNRVGVTWSVLPESGALVFDALRSERVPWQSAPVEFQRGDRLTVLPRPTVTQGDIELARRLDAPGKVALAVPRAADLDGLDCGDLLVLQCPDRLGELDLTLESKLLTSRIARA